VAPVVEALRRQADAAWIAVGEVVSGDGMVTLAVMGEDWAAFQGLRATAVG
jgi:hypothetical protein